MNLTISYNFIVYFVFNAQLFHTLNLLRFGDINLNIADQCRTGHRRRARNPVAWFLNNLSLFLMLISAGSDQEHSNYTYYTGGISFLIHLYEDLEFIPCV